LDSTKPPGVVSFGIGVDFGDIENQRKLSARSQDCGLTINNIDVRTESDVTLSEIDDETSTEEDSRSYNPWIGDPLGNRAEECLAGICYPGDDHLSSGIFDPTRFCVYSVKGDRHIIVKSERDERGDGNSIYIPDRSLRDPRFDIV